MAWRGGVTRKYIRNRVYRLGERKRLCRAAMLLFRVLEISTVKWLINSDGWPWFSNIARGNVYRRYTIYRHIHVYNTPHCTIYLFVEISRCLKIARNCRICAECVCGVSLTLEINLKTLYTILHSVWFIASGRNIAWSYRVDSS